MQLNQDPGDGSTMDSGHGTVVMKEEDAEADMAGDEEVKGGDGEAAIDVTLNALLLMTWHGITMIPISK